MELLHQEDLIKVISVGFCKLIKSLFSDSWKWPLVLCSVAPFTRLFHYLPFLLLLLRNPAERIFFGEQSQQAFTLDQMKAEDRHVELVLVVMMMTLLPPFLSSPKALLRSCIFNKRCNLGKTHMKMELDIRLQKWQVQKRWYDMIRKH